MNFDEKPNFLFALHTGDSVKIYKDARSKKIDKDGEIFKIAGVNTDGRVKIWHHTDARPWHSSFTKEYQDKYDVPVCPTLTTLRDRLVKVEVDVVGKVTLLDETR